jgi:hypothetical protein
MEQSLFSFNSYTLYLSAPTPTPYTGTTQSILTSAYLTGITRVNVNFNQLFTFTSKPFKIIMEWPDRPAINLNEPYLFQSSLASVSSFFQANSALVSTVVCPKNIGQSLFGSSIKVYYSNGCIQTFNVKLLLNSDNIIDMDLDVLDIQNTNQSLGTIFNLQSNTRNTVFNCTDNIISSEFDTIYKTDGYV